MDQSLLVRIQDWYRNNCNGDWEHGFGIKIQTVDNPGWSLEIELEDTSLENAQFKHQYDKGDNWIFIEIRDKKFIGAGDPNKLNEILRMFLDDVLPTQNDHDYLYQVYLEVPNSPVKVWKEVKAKPINESVFEIVNIENTSLQNLKVLDLDDFAKIDLDKLIEPAFSIGDRVKCEFKSFFEGGGPVAFEIINKEQ